MYVTYNYTNKAVIIIITIIMIIQSTCFYYIEHVELDSVCKNVYVCITSIYGLFCPFPVRY